ncbi:MAG: lamin tail domain-containing protein [Phycisphaerae bacterium]|nr:lamin tail domain-containing protein [Phycisphaerae bacterium]
MFKKSSFLTIQAFIITCLISCYAFAACPAGDINKDCIVNIEDLEILAWQWLSDGTSPANLDQQGKVDLADLAILSKNWLRHNQPLAINEFMAANSSFIKDPQGQYEDWIEIHNFSDQPIDLAGMYLTDDLTTPSKSMIPVGFGDATIVPAGGFLILWADNDPTDGPTHLAFKLSASGESIALFDTGLNLIDAIENYPLQNPDDSFGRLPDGLGDWQTFPANSEKGPTPAAPNDQLTADRNIIISEIMYHPSSQNDLEEYVELFNKGNAPVSLLGWKFNNGITFTFGDVTIPAKSYLVIAADQNAFTAKYPAVTNYVAGWFGHLANSGENLKLINASGGIIDELQYCDEAQWSKRILGPDDYGHRGWLYSDAHDGLGKSLELINPNLPNESGSNWQAGAVDQGTPGSQNSSWLNNTAPIIAKVKQAPIIPNSTENVIITAKIIDEQTSVLAVILYYRLDQSVYAIDSYPEFDPAEYSTITMYDDGDHNDAAAGDGIYAAAIPPFADGDIVEYFIEASDNQGNIRTMPAACDIDGIDQQVANHLYQVDDSYDPDTIQQGGEMPVFYLIMTEAESARLAYIGSHDPDRYSNAVMNGTFIGIDGTDTNIRFNVGIRNRGEGTRRQPPNNYRVRFNHNDQFRGVSKINLNSKYTTIP